ncbi:hypothetical protein SEA_CEN1621_32 [Microbacterium phage Cen1621]|uniref:Lipoprotein n=1 Tax=Microbacterium phage Cen1621 TaxID=2965191 RepID=A0A9E7TWV0_9CAUD|nr:hypothetical protein SEA_CEN1621_32 [Microbacterium phage Cen1621]
MIRKLSATVAVGAMAALALTGCTPAFDGDTTSCEVTEKETQTMAALAKRPPRVYTSCGVFVVEDNALVGQWNSADTYNAIEPGKVYDFEAVGWRNGFFSLFPNIIGVEEVAQ